nr:pectinesterase [Paenibacillus turpanensis]
MKKLLTFLLSVVMVLSLFQLPVSTVKAGYDALPAFPGAEGFGYAAVGGRGGEVYHVTSYELKGPGTFHDALTTAGSTPRTIVFDISGEITIPQIVLRNKSKITIAGQTAPGGGVTIRGNNIRFINCSDIIIRYMTFRLGRQSFQDDTMYFEDCQNVIIDHSSFSWGTDEVLSIKSKNYEDPKSKNITVQWSIISEGLLTHSMGGLIEMNTITMHHNLYAHNNDRNPKTKGQIDFVNNIVYNWGGYPYVAGGESGTKGYGNVVGNYFVAGLNSADPQYAVVRGNENYSLYLDNNRIDSNKNGVLDGSDTGIGMMEAERPSLIVPERFEYPPVHTQEPEAAYEYVLDYAGASLYRDAVDQRVTDSVRYQTGVIIGHEDDAGGFPQLPKGTAAADSDRDGMPDAWETAKGLDPSNPEDRNGDSNGDGYTHLEDYLNELAAPGFPAIYPMSPLPWAGSPFIPPVQPTPEPEPDPTPAPILDGELLRNVVIHDNSGSGSTNAANYSIQQNLQPGDFVAGDRMTGSNGYRFVTVPDEVKGMEWIRSAVGSRSSSTDDLVSFYITADTEVYVGHDSRITTLPAWLRAYEDTGLVIEDSQPVQFKLYKKNFAAGSFVQMGPNGSTSRMNYFVIVKPASPEAAPPAAGPAEVTAAQTEDNVVALQWSAVDGAERYLVYRASMLDHRFRVIASAGTEGYTDTGAEQGMVYDYKVSAVNAGGESPHSTSVSVSTFDPSQSKPSVPAKVSVTSVNSISVGLEWGPVEGAMYYSIYRAPSQDGPFTKIAHSLYADYNDLTVTPATAYYYRITATGIGGETAMSDTVSATTKPPVAIPQKPAGLTADEVTTSNFSFHWNPVEAAESYNIYRRAANESANDFVRVGSATAPSYVDDSVSVSRNGYSYRVTAANEMGESVPSDELALAMPLPATPSNLTVGAKGEDFVGLLWTSHGGAAQYNIYRESEGSPVVMVGYAKVDTFYDRSVEPGIEYTYYIKAQNASGESEASNVVKVKTLETPKDVTPPVTTTNAKTGWQNAAQVIILTAVDAEGVVGATYYSVNDEPFVSGNEVTIHEEGLHTLRYYSVDAAGNEESIQQIEIQVDVTGPNVVPTVTTTVYRSDSLSLPFQITDSLSGVAKVEASLNGGAAELPLTVNPYTLSIGDHRIVITAQDHAGNVTVYESVLHVTMDRAHLDKALQMASDNGWISNHGVYNSLRAKVKQVQNANREEQARNALIALEHEVTAQSGKHIDQTFAQHLLSDLGFLIDQIKE